MVDSIRKLNKNVKKVKSKVVRRVRESIIGTCNISRSSSFKLSNCLLAKWMIHLAIVGKFLNFILLTEIYYYFVALEHVHGKSQFNKMKTSLKLVTLVTFCSFVSNLSINVGLLLRNWKTQRETKIIGSNLNFFKEIAPNFFKIQIRNERTYRL